MTKPIFDVPRILEAPTTVEARYVRMAYDSEQFGVAIKGARFVAPLPRGYSEHSQIVDFFGSVLISHPGLPTLLVDGEHGRTVEVDFSRIQAQAKQMRNR